MQGTILIIDGVSTNRIMLKVLLSAAWYHVVQADRLEGLKPLLRRTRPDLVLAAMNLPDGTALRLRDEPLLDEVPVVAIAAQNDRDARLAALAAGIDDVLSQPIEDSLLQARIRSLIRARSAVEDLQQTGATTDPLGMAEAAAGFAVPRRTGQSGQRVAHVALVAADRETGTVWRRRLTPVVPHRLDQCAIDGVQRLMAGDVPDAVVVGLTPDTRAQGLELLANLRARPATRRTAIIAVTGPEMQGMAADALDRGADDVMTQGFCAEELALRLATLLRRKDRSDRVRANLRDGLRAAIHDPLTGLHNRRHALPYLSAIARDSARNGREFAVMLADLDRFKRINDRHGHQTGDEVLIEAARRFRAVLGEADMIARIGGEEFLIVLPDTGRMSALATADRLCRNVEGTPFRAGSADLAVTVSIGVVNVTPEEAAAQSSETLVARADAALYQAKRAGRNTVSLARAVA